MIRWLKDSFNNPKTPLIVKIWLFTTFYGLIAVLLVFVVAIMFNWKGFLAHYSQNKIKRDVDFNVVRYQTECAESIREEYSEFKVADISEFGLTVTVKYHTKEHPFTMYCLHNGKPELLSVQEYFERRAEPIRKSSN